MREKRWRWEILVVVLLLVVLPHCQKAVVKEDRAMAPEEEKALIDERALEEQRALEAERERKAFEETLTAKKYPGIAGEVMESTLFQDVHFGFDKYDLTPEARRILADNAKVLLARAELRVQIEGHCDERGSNEYNLALGEKRALSAKLYLVKLGVRTSQLSTISYGEEMPMDPRHNEEAWYKNRRDEFKITSY